MQKNDRKTPMPNCDFKKVANLHIFRTTFPRNDLWVVASEPLTRSRLQMFFKIDVLENFPYFIRKHPCWRIILIKLPEGLKRY